MHEFPFMRLLGMGLLLAVILTLMVLSALAEALHPYGRPTPRRHPD